MTMRSPPPAISVCIPAYNSARFIGETLRSVLAQTFEDFELIVVDDASTDGTADVVASISDPRLRLLRNAPNIGAEANWNRAVGLSRGDFVKLVCGDDTLRPDCLQTQWEALQAHPRAVFAAGRRDIITETGMVMMRRHGLGGLAGLVSGPRALRTTVRQGTNIFGEPAAILIRRGAMTRCGPFSGQRPYVIDLDYWCRLLELGPVLALPRTVASFRVALTSWSVRLSRLQSSQVSDLFRALHHQSPAAVLRTDVALGSAKAKGLALGRAISYRTLAAATGTNL